MPLPWRTPAALLVLLVLTAGFYWQLTISGRYTWLENPDQALQVRPWLDYEARELHAGRLPLWAPYEWGGQSLIGQVQPGLVNPLNWPLFAMPLRDGHIPTGTLHWYWVLIHWVAAAFMFWLCRDLGAGFGPSILGGSVYALAGFLGHSDTPQFLMGAVWIPLMLLFLARVGRGQRVLGSAAWSGAALGAAFLGGHHNIPIYTSVVLGGVWVWLLARHWRQRRMWMAAALFGVVASLVAAVQILPAVEYGRQSLRWAGAPDALKWNDRIPYSVHENFSLGLRGIPGLVLPGLAVHAQPLVGSVAVALALIALWYGRRRWEVRMLGAVALGSLLLALGSVTPVERVAYEIIPMVEKARYPAFAIVICQAGIAALAALGLEIGLAGARQRKAVGAAWWMAGFAAAVCSYYLVCRWLGRPTYAEPLWPAVTASTGLALVWLALGRGWRQAAPAAALALFFVEATAVRAPVQPRDAPGSYERIVESQRDIADFLRAQPGWFRVWLDQDAVPYNFGDWYGIEQFGSYTASMPIAVHALVGHAETARLFGVVYNVARKPANASQVAVFHSRSGLNVYRDPAVGPPMWLERPAVAGCAPDQLRVTLRTPEDTRIDATAGCPGLLVVGDPWFTGWRAWVDGRRVRIQQYEGVTRALALEAGTHRVEFRYQPGSVWWGAGLSLLGLGVALVVHFRAQ
ncbi:MAG TPA: hypothetical protein VME43_33125 [Bryobacteraceae bacterium]|nr:hypothetical protein [Bryobacteraceae bacterium]